MTDTNQLLDALTLRKQNTEIAVLLVEPTPGRWRVYRLDSQQCVNWIVTVGRWFASRFDALRFIQEKGYAISGMQPDRVYRFRAECQPDVEELRRLLGAKVRRITITVEPPFPDVEVEIDLDMTLDELRNTMRQVVDGHVMVQTVARRDDYTGERDYKL